MPSSISVIFWNPVRAAARHCGHRSRAAPYPQACLNSECSFRTSSSLQVLAGLNLTWVQRERTLTTTTWGWKRQNIFLKGTGLYVPGLPVSHLSLLRGDVPMNICFTLISCMHWPTGGWKHDR
jgi:hypothetical protein